MTDSDPAIGPLDPPRDFGPYELLEQLAFGAIVDVYRARTRGIEGFERSISLRCLRDSDAISPEVVSEFVEHAKRSSALQHANIASVLDLGKIDGVYYVAAEYVAGPSIDALVEVIEGPLPAPIAVHIATKILEALEYAHNRTDESGHALELLHSGIAPDDVAVSADGQVKLLTFGASRGARSGPGSVGVASGRIGYMSPEQVRGLPLDRRSDTFAVGVILHEMLTGRRLFAGETEFEILEKIRKVEVTPPSLLNHAVPAGLEDLVLKALDRAPAERFQTANHMARELQKWAIGADQLLNDGDVRAFVGEIMPDLVTPAPALPPTPETQPEPSPIDDDLHWDDEEIETAIFARRDGMIPRPAASPEPDEELGEWSRDHATGVRRRPDSVSGMLPAAESSDLGDLGHMPLASGEIPAVGILASPDANTGFEPTVDEILRAESSGDEPSVPTASAPAKELAAPDTEHHRAPADGDPPVRRTDAVPEVSGGGSGLGWMIGLATAVLIGLLVLMLRGPSGEPSAIQIALTPSDVEYTILVDGTVVHEGLVPTAITELEPGRHELTVRADGYRERTEFVQVTPQAASLIDWEIEAVRTVTVPIQSVPVGASVTIDGTEAGITPLDVELILGALVNIELSLIGHDPHATSFIVTERASGVTVALTELDGGATVDLPIISVPDGAEYAISAEPGGEVVATGRTPEVATLQVGGTYRVAVSAEGFEGAVVPLLGTPTGFESVRIELRALDEETPDEEEQGGDEQNDYEAQEPREANEPGAVQANTRDERMERQAEALVRDARAEREAQEAEDERRRVEEERAAAAEREARERQPELPAEVEEPSPVAGPPGFINVRSTPPATIVIDGTDTGLVTPADGIPLSSGVRHRVELVNEAAGLHRTYRVSLDPGQVRNIVNQSN